MVPLAQGSILFSQNQRSSHQEILWKQMRKRFLLFPLISFKRKVIFSSHTTNFLPIKPFTVKRAWKGKEDTSPSHQDKKYSPSNSLYECDKLLSSSSTAPLPPPWLLTTIEIMDQILSCSKSMTQYWFIPAVVLGNSIQVFNHAIQLLDNMLVWLL